MADNRLLTAHNLHKTYRLDLVKVPVLRGVDLEVKKGEFLTIVGVSGSGKSTLLHLLGALDCPDQGSVVYDNTDIFAAADTYRDDLRNRSFGFVFQFYHLLPELTVLENVTMPALIGSTVGMWLQEARGREDQAKEMLGQLGLSHRMFHLPGQLSGGERQRVAIARAIVNSPVILFADEPTGNLDAATGKQIFQILLTLNKAGQTIIMVTHDTELANQTHRIVKLHDGRIAAN
ncbi:MAG: ABC transporter ATP-binding protein [Planctomycetes bacterium]|nr:ABC transporter ATP-binding protein [Planctomycetota bacterium]